MAPGIPSEKSRTVRPVHGPATVHLPFEAYGHELGQASSLSLQCVTGSPSSLQEIPSSRVYSWQLEPICETEYAAHWRCPSTSVIKDGLLVLLRISLATSTGRTTDQSLAGEKKGRCGRDRSRAPTWRRTLAPTRRTVIAHWRAGGKSPTWLVYCFGEQSLRSFHRVYYHLAHGTNAATAYLQTQSVRLE